MLLSLLQAGECRTRPPSRATYIIFLRLHEPLQPGDFSCSPVANISTPLSVMKYFYIIVIIGLAVTAMSAFALGEFSTPVRLGEELCLNPVHASPPRPVLSRRAAAPHHHGEGEGLRVDEIQAQDGRRR